MQKFLAFIIVLLMLFTTDTTFAQEEEDAAAKLAIEMVGPNNQHFITSELVQYIFEESKGIYLPRFAQKQKELGTEVERDDLQAGDVVFFQGSSLMSGVYIENGRFVIVTSDGITERNLDTSKYWSDVYVGAKRYSEEDFTVDDPAAQLALDRVGENHEDFITSELVQFIYTESKNLSLPRSASDQWLLGESVEQE
ncbi:C40 family peptidase, partial [Alteribacillus bidgolensis]